MEQLQTIPDDAPTVSFDVTLGHDYHLIDFDYEAFASEAERIGLSRESASELQVYIEPFDGIEEETVNGGPEYLSGVYLPENHRVHVRTDWRYGINNYVLVHEMGHAVDRKSLLRFARLKTIGKFGLGLAGVAFLATGATMLADKIYSWEAREAINIMQIGTVGLVVVASLLNIPRKDFEREAEVRANKAARAMVHDILKYRCRIHTNAEISREVLEELERKIDEIRNQSLKTLDVVSW